MDNKKVRELEENKVLLRLSLLEAALIVQMRKSPYSKHTVFYDAGHPVRVVSENSKLLTTDEALAELAKEAATSNKK